MTRTNKPWRELLCVTALYHKAGEHPWPNFIDADAYITENQSADWENAPDDWWADGDLWWFPDVGTERKEEGMAYPTTRELPDLDANHRLLTDAVQFIRISAANVGRYESYGPGGLLNHEIDGNGVRGTFIGCADDIKALCDLVRDNAEGRWVDAIIVFECDAGKDPDTWMGPGDYWSDWQPVGLLDLKAAPLLIPTEEAAP